jgi:16S rRNA (guanine1516-N2)-methyltransferase
MTTGDTVAALQDMERTGRQVDVVYLDPMFPARQKSARVKKDLQILQLLTTDQSPPNHLLSAALAAAARRVVVKRPRRAPCLTECSPSHCLTGKTIRFDVYLT